MFIYDCMQFSYLRMILGLVFLCYGSGDDLDTSNYCYCLFLGIQCYRSQHSLLSTYAVTVPLFVLLLMLHNCVMSRKNVQRAN